MKRTSDPRKAAATATELEGLDTLAGPDAAEAVARALRRTGTAERAVGRDLDVLRALRDTPNIDAVLDHIDLNLLAALIDRQIGRLDTEKDGTAVSDSRLGVWDALDLVRRPAVLRRVAREDLEGWTARILRAVESAHFTVGPLFHQRAERYGSKVLFNVPQAAGSRGISWRRVASRVEQIARGLISLADPDEPGRVAILSENRIEMALVDLACLTSGIVDVMVPANSTENDVEYILRHSGAATVVVSDRSQLRKVLQRRDRLPDLRRIVCLTAQDATGEGVLSLDAVTARADRVPAERVVERSAAVRIDELATVMYTSGTTGVPKAIMFSQRNLVFKRFARALALPEIGEDDVFLCFLPLFHTFGRFLEMLGCVFWGATYCFLPNPSLEALIRGMRRHRPTVFISVPKKWMQLHEAIVQRADPVHASDEELLRATREVTGGRLAWGLSAAGHLDSDIFRFFQQQGVELMSGFGMTEGTGGMTMTPPGAYRENSLGRALPGIELRLADDGELMARGPYVMMGYLDPPDGEAAFDEQGWLPTGDLMEIDPDGHLRLIDRKKEIYKNVKGETIAPQRIENMFREMESVGRVFLVGDHKEYNTLLIHPNMESSDIDFAALSAEQVREHFRSLVVSVNKFLAPFERIVDFAVIDRDLDVERGELTPKGTPRRSAVVQNFDAVIRELYRGTSLHVGGVKLILPNWLIQALGLTAQDIRVGDERIILSSSGRSLTVKAHGERVARVGSCLYRHPAGAWSLGALLRVPRLWLGNEELVDFVDLDTSARRRPGRSTNEIEWLGRPRPFEPGDEEQGALEQALRRSDHRLLDVHLAATMLSAADNVVAAEAVRLLQKILTQPSGPLAEPSRQVLYRTAATASAEIRRCAFLALLPSEPVPRFRETLDRFLGGAALLLDERLRAALCERDLPEAKLETFVAAARDLAITEDAATAPLERVKSLLGLLSAYGAAHPTRYRRLRSFLVRMSLVAYRPEVRDEALAAVEVLQDGFRQWLGPSSRVAVDSETGQEYRWRDVVVFDDSVVQGDRERLLDAIRSTPMLREATFLFSQGVLIRLSDIPPGGIWIRLLGASHGKAVYRMTVQTRFQGSYDLAVNVNHSLTAAQVRDEIHWLILSGESEEHAPLVEDFGGFWPQQDLWSEEFIPGETLDHALRRLSKRDEERFRTLWPFLAWTALSAYVDFWNRSGGRWELADPSLSNVVAPTDDYHTGVRLVSVSARRRHRGLLEMMRSFMRDFIEPAVAQYPVLDGLVGWPIAFSSVLEVVGEDDGLALFGAALKETDLPADDDLATALPDYLKNVRLRGFLPRRLFFAAKRYRRWERLSRDATLQARARTLQELFDTYGLQHLAHEYPEIRVRFFRETVFRGCPETLAEGLEQLIAAIRGGELVGDELMDAVADLRARLDLGPDEDYFLARISLPYLRPEDAADFESSRLGGRAQSEIVVTLEDNEANTFRVRHALNPKEVERLHRLFVAAKLDVRFRPEHRYLVAISERQQIIGGIFYEVEEDGLSAHLEKIVVTEAFRRKGVADGLMTEFFNRLRSAGIKTVTTGFFRPEYFYSYGFSIEKRYAGLVKSLEQPQNGGTS